MSEAAEPNFEVIQESGDRIWGLVKSWDPLDKNDVQWVVEDRRNTDNVKKHAFNAKADAEAFFYTKALI